jgi:hypothetical protein
VKGGDLRAVSVRLGDSIEEMIRHSARIQHMFFAEGLPELSAHAYQFLRRTQFVIGFRPKEDWPMRELQMTNDPELHPLMSLRLCTALWLGSIARHGLVEKLCRASMSRFTSLRSPDFAAFPDSGTNGAFSVRKAARPYSALDSPDAHRCWQAADGRTLTDRRRRRYNAGCCRAGSHVFHVGLFLTCGPHA